MEIDVGVTGRIYVIEYANHRLSLIIIFIIIIIIIHWRDEKVCNIN